MRTSSVLAVRKISGQPPGKVQGIFCACILRQLALRDQQVVVAQHIVVVKDELANNTRLPRFDDPDLVARLHAFGWEALIEEPIRGHVDPTPRQGVVLNAVRGGNKSELEPPPHDIGGRDRLQCRLAQLGEGRGAEDEGRQELEVPIRLRLLRDQRHYLLRRRRHRRHRPRHRRPRLRALHWLRRRRLHLERRPRRGQIRHGSCLLDRRRRRLGLWRVRVQGLHQHQRRPPEQRGRGSARTLHSVEGQRLRLVQRRSASAQRDKRPRLPPSGLAVAPQGHRGGPACPGPR
mmetsp:Transcript_11351/g.35967  ORF Transcript_11351/g.35967 Transcript_11351/m.35967 type:complete len:290 (+) Transcript_11351:288-1157(+)